MIHSAPNGRRGGHRSRPAVLLDLTVVKRGVVLLSLDSECGDYRCDEVAQMGAQCRADSTQTLSDER
jgi:hypothetical protein